MSGAGTGTRPILSGRALGMMMFLSAVAPLFAEEGATDAAVSPEVAIQEGMRAAAESVFPSVVRIERIGGERQMLGGTEGGRPQGYIAPDGPTTGTVVDATHVLTSALNMPDDPGRILVTLHDGRVRTARVAGRDAARSLVLLRVDLEEGETLPVPAFAEREAIRPGRFVAALGMGFGGTHPSITVGVISAVDRLRGRALQTDAGLSPVNYGGPLVMLDGEVAGICVPMGKDGAYAGLEWYDAGIGFAVPAPHLTGGLVDRLKEGRLLRSARLGLTVDAEAAGPDGLPVTQVVPGSSAETAGLQAGDVLVRVGDRELQRQWDLVSALAGRFAGDTIEIAYRRGEDLRTVDVTLDAAE